MRRFPESEFKPLCLADPLAFFLRVGCDTLHGLQGTDQKVSGERNKVTFSASLHVAPKQPQRAPSVENKEHSPMSQASP